MHKGEKWIYPSEQMLWNALTGDGWNWREAGIQQDHFKALVSTYNATNELAWSQILEWEALRVK